METKICVVCGREFKIYPFEAGIRKACSPKCGGIMRRTPKDALCSDCKQKPRVPGRSYCRECGNKRSLATFYKYKTSPVAKRLTDEERHQYKLKKQARYRERYRARLNQSQRRYYRTHYDIHVRKMERRRARKAGVISDLTQKEWEIIKAVYGYRCAYCGKKPKLLTKDHIIPLLKGGGHTANNIVPACKSCNSRKHIARPPNFQPILTWSRMGER